MAFMVVVGGGESVPTPSFTFGRSLAGRCLRLVLFGGAGVVSGGMLTGGYSRAGGMEMRGAL